MDDTNGIQVNYKLLGSKIKEARLAMGITQIQVSNDLSTKTKDFDQGIVSKIEHGKYTGHLILLYLEYLVKKAEKHHKKQKINYNTLLQA